VKTMDWTAGRDAADCIMCFRHRLQESACSGHSPVHAAATGELILEQTNFIAATGSLERCRCSGESNGTAVITQVVHTKRTGRLAYMRRDTRR
jgi:hypothetical protein